MRIPRAVVALFLCAVSLTCLPGSPAQAGSILLFDDFQFATNPWGTALTGLGQTVTSVADDTAFATQLTSGSWDLVVVQFDDISHPSAVSALSSYVSTGGKAIFSHWLTEADSAFGVTQANTNLNTLTVGPLFSPGLSGPALPLTNPTFGIYSRSFVPGPGTTVAGTFEDGNAGIVIGNTGRTIVNGFLGETLVFDDEVRLYQNEVNSLVAPVLEPVPEPATMLLWGTTMVGVGLARWRRRQPS